jgi:hypothetical protein
MPNRATPSNWDLCLLMLVAAALVWSFLGCHDVFTWSLEVAPGIIGIAILLTFYASSAQATPCSSCLACTIAFSQKMNPPELTAHAAAAD